MKDIQGNDRGEIGSEVTGVSLKSTVPGGCSDLDFTLHRPVSFTPVELAPLGAFFRIDVSDEDGIFWSGRIERVIAHRGSDGEYFRVTARGWGVNLADQFTESTNVGGLDTGTIISNAIAALTQQIDDSSQIGTTGIVLATPTANLDRMNAAEIAQWANQFQGGASGDTQHFMTVYPDNAGTRFIYYTARPETPDITCEAASFEVAEFGFDAADAFNQVDVSYSTGSSNSGNLVMVTAKDTTLQGSGGWDFIKVLKLVMPELTAAGDATAVANAQLAAASVIRMAAATLRARSNVVFTDKYGGIVMPWRVQAGKVLQFVDVIAAESDSTLTYANSCLIVGQTWDEDQQVLTLQPESLSQRLEGLFGKSLNLLRGQHTV